MTMVTQVMRFTRMLCRCACKTSFMDGMAVLMKTGQARRMQVLTLQLDDHHVTCKKRRSASRIDLIADARS